MSDPVRAALEEAQVALQQLLASNESIHNIHEAARRLIASFEQGGKVISCGNGGSMSDAMHFAEELTGRYRDDRKALPAMAISDPGHISCVSNDFGYEAIFSRYIEAHGRSGDTLVAISTSGNSKNVLNACQTARALGMNIISLTGKALSAVGQIADVDICTPGGRYADRVQELHIKVIHILIEMVERHFFPKLYSLQ
jgi:D-sedoheptulose 7-phosphate isomerase